MRALAVLGPAPDPDQLGLEKEDVAGFELDGRSIPAAFLDVPEPAFDPAGEHRASVLVRTLAFSCNYRDGALIHAAHDEAGPGSYYVVGSELAGVVEAVGADVTAVQEGDRVIADCSYGPRTPRPWGIPTNHASRERQVLPATKVFPVPAGMPAAEAAAFAIGGQTAAAMARRAQVGPEDQVLVTSGRSNTSLFCIGVLAALGCDVSVLTTSPGLEAQLLQRGASRVFVTPRKITQPGQLAELGAYAQSCGGFTAALDPFVDVHAAVLLPLLAMEGRLVTCGARRGAVREPGESPGMSSRRLEDALSPLIVKQLSIIGNCLGTSRDLATALEWWAQDRLPVPLDTVTGGGTPSDADAAQTFLSRTFTSADRFGKVVHVYAQ